MSPNLCWLVLQITVGFISTPLIFAASAYFMIWPEQFNTGVWLFISGLVSSAGLHLNVLLFRRKIDEWYDTNALEQLKVFGLISSGAGLVSAGYYLTRAIRLNEELTFNSYYGSSIASSLTLVLGLWFFYLSRWNKRYVELCDPQLLNPPREPWRPYQT